MKNDIPPYLLQNVPVHHVPVKLKNTRFSFLDRTLLHIAGTVKSIYLQAENAAQENFIRKINPHIKLFSLIYIVVITSIVSNLYAQMFTTAFILILFIIARLNIQQLYRRIFFIAFIFGFLVVFPASLNIITPGEIKFNLLSFDHSYKFWIYNIPQEIGFTREGFQVVLLVFLRVLNSVSFAILIIFTTSFPSFIKSLRIIGVPDTFQMIISLAYKYIFILSRTIEETYFALRSRLAGNIKSSAIRRLVSGRIFFIFKRSSIIYENTYYAMVSRGYEGKIKLISQNHLTSVDIVALIIIMASGLIIILF
jgi:cobalt/nickel transport system permease protein